MSNFYDRLVQYPNRYKITDLGDGIVTLERVEGEIYQEGTKLNAETLNGMFGNMVEKEEGKGLSTNDFTDAYKNKVNNNKLSIDKISATLNNINGNDVISPTEFELSCVTTQAIKHANSVHNWYIIKNGFCFLHLDIDIVNAAITTVVAIEGLPQLFSSSKEVWDNIIGQGSNVNSNLSLKLSADTTINTTTLTIDKASAKGRYMGTIVYPIANTGE